MSHRIEILYINGKIDLKVNVLTFECFLFLLQVLFLKCSIYAAARYYYLIAVFHVVLWEDLELLKVLIIMRSW